MADGANRRKSPVNGTDWALLTLAAAAAIAATLIAILTKLF
jgi:allantoicase